MTTYTFNGRKNQWGEYRVTCYVDGKRHPAGDYHTDDRHDAIDTHFAMVASAAEWEQAPVEHYYVPLPQPVSSRGGCKVGWETYSTMVQAKAASSAARIEAERKRELGYDFGYCSPGSIEAVPNGFEVCTA